MMGMCCVRLRCLMRWASSVPFDAGHLNVQDNGRKFPVNQSHQCFLCRLRAHKAVTRRGENAFQNVKIPRLSSSTSRMLTTPFFSTTGKFLEATRTRHNFMFSTT